MQATFIIALIFAIIVAIFALLNGDTVTINLIFRQFEMSQALVILIAAVLGAVAVYFMSLVRSVKNIMKTKELEKKLKTSEAEVVSLNEKLAAATLAAAVASIQTQPQPQTNEATASKPATGTDVENDITK